LSLVQDEYDSGHQIPSMAQLEAVLLDVDGTLLDSNDAHARAWLSALGEAGHDVEFGRIRQLIGQGSDKLLVATTGIDSSSREGEALVKRRKQIFLERELPHVRAFPRARELLMRMRRGGLRLVVATSAGADEMSALLAIIGAEQHFFERTSSDEADSSKPDPDIVQAALRKAGTSPAGALMLGDTPYDIVAARHAGVRTVALSSGGWQRDALGGALAIYASPSSLLARYGSSPFRRG
jgi:HAD superfamily hydrolase (TIGR01509 family)